MSLTSFFATCPKGIETLLFREITDLGLSEVRETIAGVSFRGSFDDALMVCLWSRFASRVLMELSSFEAPTDTELYMGATGIAWEMYFTPEETIAVDFSGENEAIRNTQYGAQKVKDAICDRFHQVLGSRPDVDKENPDVRIYCHLERRGTASVSIDLSGRPLLRRGISRQTGAAPLKENLAAAMLARAAYDGGCVYDPMCGSGTLLIEAAAMATNTAPGLRRRDYGFFKLKQFDGEKWHSLQQEALERSKQGLEKAKQDGVRIVGSDMDPEMVEDARGNAQRAGFEGLIEVLQGSVEQMKNPFGPGVPALVITNPPYGKRLGNENDLISLYISLGDGLKREFGGCRAAVISSSQDLLSCMKLHAEKVYKLFNGEIPCQLRVYSLLAGRSQEEGGEPMDKASDFKNRLAKNFAHLKKWAEREGTDAYRLYDADVPEFQAAVDYYAGRVMIQAYLQKDASPKIQRARELDMIAGAIAATGAKGRDVVLKSREIQRGSSQYEKAKTQTGEFFEVHEGAMRFWVNIRDYLDTGLFLDARLIRKILNEKAQGKRFLNLFSYTATASVAAALGGAASTTSVDMSKTYLEWGRRNLDLNGCAKEQNRLVQADVLSWLSQSHDGEKFDLIYVDPPTFSNSKRMRQNFDVRRDHARLLGNVTNLLEDGGTVIFCTNSRGFKPDAEALGAFGYEVTDISAKTLPEDFKRDAKIHSCFELAYSEEKRTATPEPFEAGPAPRWQKEIGGQREGGEDRPCGRAGRSYGERREGGFGDRSRRYDDRRGGGYGDRGRRYDDRREGGYGSRSDRFYGSRRDDRFGGSDRAYAERDERSSYDGNVWNRGELENEAAAEEGKLHLKKDSGRRFGYGDKRYGRRDDRFGDRRHDDRREGGYGGRSGRFGDRRRDDRREGGYGERSERFGDRRRDERRDGGFGGRPERYGDRDRRYGDRDGRYGDRSDSRRDDQERKPTGRVFGPDGVKDL